MGRLAFAIAVLSVATLAAGPLRAGGADIEGSEADRELGASYFGEVKDIKGLKPLEGVRISAQRKGSPLPVLTTTDGEGRFRIPGFGKEVNSDEITIACTKSGWKVVDLSRRKIAKDFDSPVEIECLLEKE